MTPPTGPDRKNEPYPPESVYGSHTHGVPESSMVGSDGIPWPMTFDAQTWAKEFIRHVQERPEIASDEGTMIAWFANAIMVGYDRGKMEGEKVKGSYTVGAAGVTVDHVSEGSGGSTPSLPTNRSVPSGAPWSSEKCEEFIEEVRKLHSPDPERNP